MGRVAPPKPWCKLINQRLIWQSRWQWMGGHGWLHGRSLHCQEEAVVLSSLPPPSSSLSWCSWSCDQQPRSPHEQAVANSDKMWPCGARQSVRDSKLHWWLGAVRLWETHTHAHTSKGVKLLFANKIRLYWIQWYKTQLYLLHQYWIWLED